MTIDCRSCVLRWMRYVLAALGIWFGGIATLTVVAEPTSSVIVIAPHQGAVLNAVTGADVALLRSSGHMLLVAGLSPGFVAQLYAAGAWLVLPSRSGACIAAPSSSTTGSRCRRSSVALRAARKRTRGERRGGARHVAWPLRAAAEA